MNDLKPLALRIVRQSNGVSVRFGCTNGRPCLHLVPRHGTAETIYTAGEWNVHRWNTKRQKAAASPFANLKEALPA